MNDGTTTLRDPHGAAINVAPEAMMPTARFAPAGMSFPWRLKKLQHDYLPGAGAFGAGCVVVSCIAPRPAGEPVASAAVPGCG